MAGKNLTVDTTADSDEYRSSLASANAQNSPESSDIRKSPSSPARAEIMAESRKKARRATLVRNYNERWAKIQEENDVEVQNIKQRLLELESERKGPKQEERKINKYHEYFGFDPGHLGRRVCEARAKRERSASEARKTSVQFV